jgi:GNAT superfamily N-acetyltransferase
MKIRRGGYEDIPAVLAMFDSAIVWLAANGRGGQWGTEPMSPRPGAADRIRKKIDDGTLWIAELDGAPAGAMAVSPEPVEYVAPAEGPEVYLTLLINDRAFAGRGVGAALIGHARREAAREGVSLLRVDCYAGGDGRLVEYYRGQGFAPTERFTVGEWPGQVLEMRL